MKSLIIITIIAAALSSKGQELDLIRLENTYKTQTTIGGVAMVGGFGCLAGFIAKRDRHNEESETMQPNNHLKHARILLAFSGALTGISAYSFVRAKKNRKKYISGSPTSLSLHVTF